MGAILALGRRTVSSALRAMGIDQHKRSHRYHRVPADGGSPFGRWVELSSAGRTDPENVRAALELSALAEAANLSAHEGRPVRPGELP
jgi:hypothetical protein